MTGGADMNHVLVTGGLGFIGSHTTLELLEAGYKVTIVDNLSNSFIAVLSVIRRLSGPLAKNLSFFQVDLCDGKALNDVFASSRFDCVIHFAAFKAVGESAQKPVMYYDNNIGGTLQLVKAMELADCRRLVYSSSATVYGEPQYVPLDENHRLDAINPYGRTKLFTEAVFRDLCASDSRWDVALLRYFNPVAAHPSGDMGEHPVGVPNNLMPFVQQVAVGIRPELKVFGNDYKTRDGTAIRDYIHIMDLASAHVAACRRVLGTPFGCQAINIGTGKGTTVLEMVNSFQEASGRNIPYSFAEKRQGDAVAVWASTEKAKELLGWEAKYSVADMCADQWRWASKWPHGYETQQEEVVSAETNGNTAL